MPRLQGNSHAGTLGNCSPIVKKVLERNEGNLTKHSRTFTSVLSHALMAALIILLFSASCTTKQPSRNSDDSGLDTLAPTGMPAPTSVPVDPVQLQLSSMTL